MSINPAYIVKDKQLTPYPAPVTHKNSSHTTEKCSLLSPCPYDGRSTNPVLLIKLATGKVKAARSSCYSTATKYNEMSFIYNLLAIESSKHTRAIISPVVIKQSITSKTQCFFIWKERQGIIKVFGLAVDGTVMASSSLGLQRLRLGD